MTALSVTVLTSPGREALLARCLEMLSRQSWPRFEVLVIDDGSQGGPDVARRFMSELELRLHWRPNDGNPARSRNLGAGLARHAGLVFFDGDILPNPRALACFAACLSQRPEAAVYGYTGNTPYASASLWFPGVPVQAYDSRFCFRSRDWMVHPSDLLTHPQRYAWSGSFALRAELLNSVGGFDESFSGWGYEDIELAQRLSRQGIRLDFCLDAWGEHQQHDPSWRLSQPDKNAARPGDIRPVDEASCILYDPAFSRLGKLLESHYIPTMTQKPPMWNPGPEKPRSIRQPP